jgi:hypothetical protein
MMRRKNSIVSWVLVAHACNPSYSGGRNQEYFKASPGKKLERPYLEKTQHKKGLVE